MVRHAGSDQAFRADTGARRQRCQCFRDRSVYTAVNESDWLPYRIADPNRSGRSHFAQLEYLQAVESIEGLLEGNGLRPVIPARFPIDHHDVPNSARWRSECLRGRPHFFGEVPWVKPTA